MIGRELDDLVLHLKGLVYVRAVLEDRGAAPAAIAAHEAEIERVRSALAARVKETGRRVAA